MSCGLHFGEHYQDPVDDVLVMLFAKGDAASFAADKPLEAPPGTHFQYSSGTTNILARVIRDALDGSEQDYLKFPRRALFDRIGMRHAVIESDASGGLVGSSFMYASPRDWARFGEFLRQDGSWYGERILPPGWVRYMATLTTQSTHRNFGAHLWVKVPPPFNSIALVPPVLPEAYHAVGYEGQFVSVIPSRNLVVVRLGLSRRDHSWDQEEFLSRILEAFPG
jgi:CubicO group peptidase (beta-lactamase class C family)